jgi:hypothetical protein
MDNVSYFPGRPLASPGGHLIQTSRPSAGPARVLWDRHRLDASFDALSDQDADDRNPWDEAA